ncbi:stretch-activated cation channel mid1 [Xylographa pallens]|nr:stretch-activated cation channel mid1 [Xylographa pallens]
MANESLEHAPLSSPSTDDEAFLARHIARSNNEGPAYLVPVNIDSSNAQQEGITVMKLQELIDVCKGILHSSVQIEDIEKSQSRMNPAVQSRKAQKDRERRIWDAVEPREIRTIEVMTRAEIEANPSWEERMLEKAERLCPDVFDSWEDIWGDLSTLSDPEQNLWLQKRLMVLCCSIDEEYGTHGWIDPDRASIRERYQRELNKWEVVFKAGLKSALLASTSYIRYIGSECAEFSPGDTFNKVMVTFLVVNYSSRDIEVTIGHVLEECYRRRILVQPDADARKLYLNHIGERPMFCQSKSVERLMGLPLAKIMQLQRFECSLLPLDIAEGSKFSTFDLNISLLRSIGHLKIEWTDRHERHLLLDPESKTLEICWFSAPVGDIGSAVSKWFGTSLVLPLFGGRDDGINSLPSALEGELVRTWALLFSSSNSPRGRRKAYASLPEPRWFMRHKKMSRWLNPEDMSRYTEMRSHLNAFPEPIMKGTYAGDYDEIIESTLRKVPLEYSSFPIYEGRLRELRAYMDSSKPQGLRQLFRDNRDSLTYYTFWGVIVFGTLSVVLALFSLAVSAAQTVAGFRSLQPVH